MKNNEIYWTDLSNVILKESSRIGYNNSICNENDFVFDDLVFMLRKSKGYALYKYPVCIIEESKIKVVENWIIVEALKISKVHDKVAIKILNDIDIETQDFGCILTDVPLGYSNSSMRKFYFFDDVRVTANIDELEIKQECDLYDSKVKIHNREGVVEITFPGEDSIVRFNESGLYHLIHNLGSIRSINGIKVSEKMKYAVD